MVTPNPWAALTQAPRAASSVFQPTPEEQAGLLSSFRPVATGLGWVGETLDKPGRMVRGTLGGVIDAFTGQDPWDEFRELGNMVPFSDTLGITDPNKSTSGRDLMVKLGAPKNNENWSLSDTPWDVGGVGVEIALDPLSWVTAGGAAVTRAGKIAKAVGALDTTLAKAATKGVGKSSAKLGTTLHEALANVPDGMAKAQRYADKQGINLLDEMDKPLGGGIGFGLPFMDPAIVPTGKFGQAVAKGMDAVGGAIGNLAPVRHGRALFDSTVRSASTKAGQALGRILHGTERGADEAARGFENEFLRTMERVGPKDQAGNVDWAAVRAMAEKTSPGMPVSQDVADALDKFHTSMADMADAAEAVGLNFQRYFDPTNRTRYVPRFVSRDLPPDADRLKDAARAFRTGDPARKKRLSFFQSLSADEVNELAQATEGMKAKEIRKMLRGETLEDGTVVDGWLKQKGVPEEIERWNKALGKTELVDRTKAMSRYLSKLSDESRIDGIFTNDFVADAGQRLESGSRSIKMTDDMLEAVSNPEFRAMGKEAKTVSLDKALKQLGLAGENRLPAILKTLAAFTGRSIDDLRFRLQTEQAALKEMRKFLPEGMSYKDARALFDNQAVGAYRRILEKKGVQYSRAEVAKLKKMMISPDLVKDLKRSQIGVTLPDSANAIMEGISKGTTLFKAGVLTWPARYFRDMTSGLFRNIESGLLHPKRVTRAVKSSWNLIHGKDVPDVLDIPIVRDTLAATGRAPTPEEGRKVLGELARQYNMAQTHGELDSAMNATAGTADEMLEQMPGERKFSFGRTGRKLFGQEGATWDPRKAKVRGVNADDTTTLAPLAVGDDLGWFTESINRLTPWIEELRKGVDPAEAAKRVRDAQVDYGARNFTKFEREFMTQIFPFYRFLKGNTPYVLRQLAEKPGGVLAQTVRATRNAQQGDGILPEELAAGTAIPLGTNETGAPRYLASLGLMHEEPLALLGGGVTGGLQKLGSGLNPLLKAPIEWATGTSLFQAGRDVEDLDPTLGRIRDNLLYGDEGSFRQAQPLFGSDALEFAVGNSPLARAATTTRTLTDPRKTWPEALLNTLTGARITDVSPARQDAILRESLTGRLADHPAGRVFERVYINQDELARLSPEEQQQAQQMQAILNMLAERAKARKEAKK